MTNRDNMIPFWRVVFTYVIIVLHLFNQYGHPTAWAIGVEFFFIVSGWLMAVDLKNKKRTPYGYTWHRIQRLYPEYIPAFLVSAGCLIYFNGYNIKEGLYWAGTVGIKELLCIHFWPWNDSPLANVVTWYVSVLILAGLFLYSLCKRFPDVTKEIIIPIVIVIGLTYSYRNYSSLTSDFYEGIFYHHRFVRGFLEMGMGILLYEFSENYGTYLKNKLVQVTAFILLTFTVVASYFWGGRIEYLYLLFISIGVAVSFNARPLIRLKVLAFMDKVSYSVFLNHIIFRTYIIPKYFETLSVRMIIIYIIIVTAFSICMYFISSILHKWCKMIYRNIFKNQISS